ncbi:MAG TPA: SCO family protein [Gemmatimonadaceae bacterium]|jgi:protein SCO1/2|nr:SCO family protein [Gemmatimonadaceae bacterium]
MIARLAVIGCVASVVIAMANATRAVRAAEARDASAALPFYRSPTMTPEWLGDREASAPSMHRVADFAALDQRSLNVTQRDLDGRITIVQFFFTKCGDLCPTTTRNLAAVARDRHGQRELQLLSFSVAPDGDVVPTLAAYAAEHHITDPRWRLLTGSRSSIETLARSSFFVRLGDGSTYDVATIAHTESVLLVDGCRRLRGVYAGTLRLEMDRLREDVVTLARDPCTRPSLTLPP